MNDVLVLGANGQLGHDLCHVLSENKVSYTPWSRSELDATKACLSQSFEKIDQLPKFIINCIATTNVDGCEDNVDNAFLVNSSFVYKLARFCNEKQITLIHFSTDYIFDGTKTTAYTEDDQANPLNVYGLSKYAAEVAIANYHNKYFIFRVSSLFGKAGASGKGGNFITTMQRLGAQLDKVSVISDQITCPTATLDIARCVTHFITADIKDYGIYNCASSNSCSWFEFAESIFVLSGLDKNKVQPASFSGYKFKAKRPKLAVLDTSKLKKYYTMATWGKSLTEYFN